MHEDADLSTTDQQVLLSFKEDSTLRYHKVDQARACRVGKDLAISFYQVDYTQLALCSVLNRTGESPQSIQLEVAPVTRVVMNEDAFVILVQELTRIAKATGIVWEGPDGNA